MTTKKHAAVALVALASAVATEGCSAGNAGHETIGHGNEAVTGTPFYYFRCNNTDWGADAGSLMNATSDPQLVSIPVSVNTTSDRCSVTKVIATSPDSWGTSQSFFTMNSPATLTVPGSAVLTAKPTEVDFNVNYPAKGAFVATFNTTTSTLAVAAAGSVEGRLTQGQGSGVVGTTVSLRGPSGATIATTATNANGAYLFSGLLPATYSVAFAAAPSGAQPSYTVSATSVSVTGQAATLDGTCTPTASAPCTVGAQVLDPFHQLVVVDPAVTDPNQDARASNVTDGHFSFRYVLETLSGCPNAATNASCVSSFATNFLLNMSVVQTVNGFTVPSRNGQNLVAVWPKLADGQTLDMTKTPFQLLAIVNRTDLHSTGQGEGRLVYGEVLPGSPPQQGAFSVIVEFALPATGTLTSRAAWVNAFFALPTEDSKGAQFACASSTNPECAFAFDLQTLTDQFVAPAQLIDLRTSEIELSPGEGDTWAWRQFVLTSSGGLNQLVTAATPETPPPVLNGSSSLASFIATNAPSVRTGFVSLPSSFTGGQAEDISQAPWSFPSVDKPTLHAFSGRTCNGCHLFEPSDPSQTSGPTFHINPTIAPSANGQNLLSFFVTQIEIPRRQSFMTNWLTCGSSVPCGPGADIALMQP